MEPLPTLAPYPTRHPQSCASLSLPLLAFLHTTLPAPPALTFSIGSGHGLLEALLLHHYPARAGTDPITLYGIEVAAAAAAAPGPVNRFLPEPHALVVPGTWAVAPEGVLCRAEGLVFVYPRQAGLVGRYLRGERVRVVVWVGPRCDLEEMTTPLRAWGEVKGEGEGLVEDGEAVLVFRRSLLASDQFSPILNWLPP
ncbi:hypothetical protein B0H67DRAFT_600909 [Lasiosphaeris hirsuta]|uniref:Uncharacterized protein n=1 Tax=Lasiosphaeris hirsuta TaxID=260670 RepID=A0AA40AG48_9PEZI|nr:hypothetical protein B0H67DRAFT_600909 [Lasiosphaeris hirsuta]